MNLTLSDEQQMLRESLRRFLKERYPFALRSVAALNAGALSKATWTAMANDLGILGAGFAEDLGGMGGGPVETMIIMEEFGHALVAEPYIETIVIAGEILSRSGGETARTALAEVLSGDLLFAYAWAEPGGSMDPRDIATAAVRDGEGWRLSGRKVVVTAAPWASHLIIPARTSGKGGDDAGLSLFLVDKSRPGISLCNYTTIDGRPASDIDLDNVAIPSEAMLGAEGAALPLLDEIADYAIAAMCAEAVGIMTYLLEATMTYTKERRQFGNPLSSFQVLQHRMADMLIEIELARSAAYLATLKLGAAPDVRARATSAAKVTIGAAGRLVGQNAVQLHGAMGMTDELAVGHYFKRLMAISADFGGEDRHRARHALLSAASRSASRPKRMH